MTTTSQPRLLVAELELTFNRFLSQGERYRTVEVRAITSSGTEWRAVPFPGDFGEPAVFLGQQVAGLDSDARRRCLGHLYAAAETYWVPGQEAEFGYAVGLMLGLVPGTPPAPVKVVKFLSRCITKGALRRQPSPQEDLHQQSLAALGRPELASNLDPAVLDVLRRDLKEPVYAAASILALATHSKTQAAQHLPTFLDAADRGGYPPQLILFQFALRMNSGSDGSAGSVNWTDVGRALRDHTKAAEYMSALLLKMGRTEARDSFAKGLETKPPIPPSTPAPKTPPKQATTATRPTSRPVTPREPVHRTDTRHPLVTEVNGKITIPVVDRTGAGKGTVEIDPADFGGKISRQLMHDVVLMYLANQRAGTHHTLRRGQVAGSTKKLFRQKGTGNARAGTKRTNKRRGGGTAKGPKPRDYEYHLPKKAVKAATRMAILSKFMDKEVVVLDEFTLAAPKTKEVTGLLKAIKIGKKATEAGERDVTLADTTVLIGTAGLDANVYKSARNIEGVKVLPAAEFNCYTVLKQKRLVLTKAALKALVKPVAAPKAAAAPATESGIARRGRAAEFAKRKATAKK